VQAKTACWCQHVHVHGHGSSLTKVEPLLPAGNLPVLVVTYSLFSTPITAISPPHCCWAGSIVTLQSLLLLADAGLLEDTRKRASR
jgi:hypothetical protein